MSKTILLGHGSGGRMTHQLIQEIFVKYFNNETLSEQTDAAILENPNKKIAFTTDSYVVDPLFFPGGNIGKLAVCGTVNDLAVSGAQALYLSCGFIIEEGFLFDDLETIVKSMAEEAFKAGVKIVTGDTKVVNKSKCDKIFINTSGIGIVDNNHTHIASGNKISIGDKIIINGSIGDHGIAIMGSRENLKYETNIESDCASLNHLINKIIKQCEIHFMRDATRGGIASVVCEITQKHKIGIALDESRIPIKESVRGLCEVFGFDPLYVANEGKFVIIAPKKDANKILELLQADELGKDAAIIGEITENHLGKVILNTSIGGKRMVDMLAGEQLPRIC